MKYKLRPKQVEAVNNIDCFIKSNKTTHGLFIYPTSFGKSLVISELASKYPDKYFINVTTSKELLDQNYKKFTSYGFIANLCSESLGDVSVGKITFATIGTLSNFVDFFKDKDVVIIDDEAHEGSAKGSQLDKFLKKLNRYKLAGVTATPFRLSSTLDGSVLKLMHTDKDCIYNSIEDVVQIASVFNGYWAELKYYTVKTDKSSLKLNKSKTDFEEASLVLFNEDNNLIDNLVDKVVRLTNYGRKSILISVPFIEDALALQESLPNCRAIYSGMDEKERDLIVENFKNLSLPVVVQCKILSVGFDHPMLDAIILAKPSNSLTFYYQLVGRGVRQHKHKTDCIVLDLSGNYERFGDIRDISIEYVENYGWAVFSKDILMTDIILGSNKIITKQDLIDGKTPKTDIFEFTKEHDGLIKMPIGKFKGQNLKHLYFRKRWYLKYLYDSGFKHHDKKIEETLKLMFDNC